MQGKFNKKTILVDNAIYDGARGFSVYQEFLSDSGMSLIVSKGWLESFSQSEMTLNENYLLQGVFRPIEKAFTIDNSCLLYTSPSPRDKRQSRMPSSA